MRYSRLIKILSLKKKVTRIAICLVSISCILHVFITAVWGRIEGGTVNTREYPLGPSRRRILLSPLQYGSLL